MSRTGRRNLARIVMVFLVALSLSGCDWMFIHSSVGNSGSAVDPGFGPAQLASLKQTWRFHPGYAIDATPVTFGKYLYLAGGNGVLYALDTSNIVNGAPTVAWSHDYGMRTPSTCPTDPVGLVSTPAVRKDANGNPLLYVYTPQGTLQELNGLTGAPVWTSTVYTVPADNQNDYFSWSSPSYSDATGLVYIGISSECDAPFVPSGVKAFDENTGALPRDLRGDAEPGRPRLREPHAGTTDDALRRRGRLDDGARDLEHGHLRHHGEHVRRHQHRAPRARHQRLRPVLDDQVEPDHAREDRQVRGSVPGRRR